MPTEILTTGQYAEKHDKERTSVFKAAKQNKLHLLPDVTKIIRNSRYILLETTIKKK